MKMSQRDINRKLKEVEETENKGGENEDEDGES